MHTEPLNNSEESDEDRDSPEYVPFDGFVNVNDIVKKRRQLRMAQFNNPDRTWDTDNKLEIKKDGAINPEK